mgnify:CR=1 FL=1
MENFVFLIIVPIAILFVIYKSPNKNIFKAFIGLASIFLIGYGVFILSVIAWYFFNTKEDITGYGLSDNTLIKIIYNFFKVLLYEWGGGYCYCQFSSYGKSEGMKSTLNNTVN